jgi:hypothetical protein
MMKRNIARATLVIVSATALWAAVATPATAQHFPGIGIVMTYNVNEGSDFLQAVGAQERGFLKEGDTITNIDFPGTNSITAPLGINNSGAITGWFCNTNRCGGFVRSSSRVFTAVNHPGSKGSTTIGGINDRGDICGYWLDSVTSVWEVLLPPHSKTLWRPS